MPRGPRAVNVDNVPGVLLLHDRQHMLGADVGSAEAALHERVAVSPSAESAGTVHFVQGKIRLAAGIVHQYVDPIESSRDSLDQSLTLRFPDLRLLWALFC